MRTNGTEQKYLRRAGQLYARAQDALFNKHISNQEWIVWLVSQQPKIARPTWRQYKASIIFYLQQQRISDDIGHAIDILQSAGPMNCCKKGIATSANKQKKINDTDLTRLINSAAHKNMKHGTSAMVWLLAGMISGLRPSEWQYARINEGNQLVVKNAKSTNGRSHGVERTIELVNLSDQDKQVIELHLGLIKKAINIDGFNSYYEHCRSALYELTRAIWPKRKKHITLYSARHQFSANAKRSGLSLEEIAALMGHASTQTATEHYGRKVSGSPNGVAVRASNGDVERVILLNQHRNEKALSRNFR
ncbi:MAG: site-specific integrase [Methylococcaceae bacterium]|nr:site-specific integrase [Methylococcaceae bacterium]